MVQRWLFAIFPTLVRHPFDGLRSRRSNRRRLHHETVLVVGPARSVCAAAAGGGSQAATAAPARDLASILQRKSSGPWWSMSGASSFRQGAQHGILVNQLQGFERWLNQTYLAKEKIKLKIIYIPVRQDKLLDYLTEGRGSGGRQHDGDADPARTGDLLQPGDRSHRRVGGEPAQPADLQPYHPALLGGSGCGPVPAITRACASSTGCFASWGYRPSISRQCLNICRTGICWRWWR